MRHIAPIPSPNKTGGALGPAPVIAFNNPTRDYRFRGASTKSTLRTIFRDWRRRRSEGFS